MNALARKTMSTLSVLALVPTMFGGCTESRERVTITLETPDGTSTVEDLDHREIDLGIRDFPTWIVDGESTRDPAALVTGKTARLEREGAEPLVLEREGNRVAIVAGDPPESGIVAISFDESRLDWTLTGLSGAEVKVSLDGVRPSERDAVLGLYIGNLLAHRNADAEAAPYSVPIIPIVVGVGFLACVAGTCATSCSQACAPNSVQSFSSSCWPFYSSCTCNCFANNGQTPSPNPNPVPTPSQSPTPSPSPGSN